MPARGRDIIVIGCSAGGLQALDELLGRLPTDIPAAICIVQHIAPHDTGAALMQRLGKHRAFECKLAADGEKLQTGRVYVGPADHHVLIKKRRLLVRKGARENRYRPGIDPLFRSAATEHGAHVIGVLLTGMLDDGTAGMIAVKECGGVTVVQDPSDAAYPDMPRSALSNLAVDHCVPLAEMGVLLESLARERPRKARAAPAAIRTEAVIAERVLSDVSQVNGLGDQAPYNCPNCGGVLWEIASRNVQRYRCHTGHSFTATALLTSQSEKIEETLWVSLRMFEERKNLLNSMAQRETHAATKRMYSERANDTQIHIARIRAMLLAGSPPAAAE